MKNLKNAVFMTAALSLMFFAACGGGDDNKKNPTISIAPMTATIYVGETKSLEVTATNTDFTVATAPSTGSTAPATGAGCVKSGSNVACTPTEGGEYDVTVTATANTSRKSTAKITVPELEISGNTTTFNFFANDLESEPIRFNAGRAWQASTAAAWITINTPSSGTAGMNKSITLTLTPNDTHSDRTASVIIATEKKPINVTVNQKYTTADGTDFGTPGAITIDITPKNAETRVNTAYEFAVEVTNTDFRVSTNTSASAGCAKGVGVNINKVICTPTQTGTFPVTVEALADSSKKDTAELTVTAAPAVSITIAPGTVSTTVGVKATFNVTLVNTSDFSVTTIPATGAGCVKGAITSNSSGGTATVDCTPTVDTTYTVTVAASADNTKTNAATLTVTPSAIPSIDITPKTGATATVGGAATEFTVTVANSTDFTVSTTTATGTTTTAAGCAKSGTNKVVCAPTAAGTYTVTVTTTATPVATNSATLTVNPAASTVAISINPGGTQTIALGASQTYTVDITGTSNTAFSVTAPGAGCGTQTGMTFSCTPTAAGTYTITVTATADSSKTATATLTVTGGSGGGDPSAWPPAELAGWTQWFGPGGAAADENWASLAVPSDAYVYWNATGPLPTTISGYGTSLGEFGWMYGMTAGQWGTWDATAMNFGYWVIIIPKP